MRINKLEIFANNNLGLQKNVSQTEKSVIALVGKNGSGKSRILHYIKDYNKHLKNNSRKLLDYIDIDNQIKMSIPFPNPEEIQEIYEAYPFYIKDVKSDTLKDFKKQSFTQTSILVDELMKTKTNEIVYPLSVNEFESLFTDDTIKYLKSILQDYFDAEITNHLNLGDISEETEENINHKRKRFLESKFHKFNTFIELFLNKKIVFKAPMDSSTKRHFPELYIDNLILDFAHLSDGEKILFNYAVLFFLLSDEKAINIKNSIILLDEPETHLHPDAQILLIDKLKEITENSGQLWIATHSLHILSHLQSDEIFYVENGNITPPSRQTPSKALKSIASYENHIEELKDLITSTSSWAYTNFITQCFKEPDVIFNKNLKDKEYLLLKKVLNKNKVLKVLDYGAGYGRIGHTIFEDKELKDSIRYNAFEPSPKDLDLLSKICADNIVFTELKNIPKAEFDIVILCSVFHEIEKEKWKETFQTIKSALNEKGILVIVEDKYLPIGEKIGIDGYLIFRERELNIMLGREYNFISSEDITTGNSRFVYTEIKKNDINYSDKSAFFALKELKETIFSEILNIRSLINNNSILSETDLNYGRTYANLSQLYINICIALKDKNNPFYELW
jgi:energy-coupling factor transporter ATP-binding protein EcfA2